MVTRQLRIRIFGLPFLISVAACLASCTRKDRHAYQASCDGRDSDKYCEDYYYDVPSEIVCTEPVKLTHTPCDRAKVLGGCRGRGMIRWFYTGSADAQATSGKCSFDDQWIPADWKEQEDK